MKKTTWFAEKETPSVLRLYPVVDRAHVHLGRVRRRCVCHKPVRAFFMFLMLGVCMAGGLFARQGNYNFAGPGGALHQYRQWEDNARKWYDTLEDTYDRIRKGDSLGTAQMQGERELANCQSKMKSIREEAARNGYTIQRSRYETAWPRRP